MKRLLGNNYYTLADICVFDFGSYNLTDWFEDNDYFGLDSTLASNLITILKGQGVATAPAYRRYVLQSDYDAEDSDDADGFQEDMLYLESNMVEFFSKNNERWLAIQTAMESAKTNAFENPTFSRTRDEDITDTSSGSSSSNGYTTENPTTPITLEDATATQYIDAGSASTGSTSGENVRDGTITESGNNGTKYSMEIAEDVERVYQEVGQLIYNEFARRFFIL